MTESNDDTSGRSTSIRDQLRVYTNDIDPKSASPGAGGFAVRPPSALDEKGPTEIKWECNPKQHYCGQLTCATCSDPQRLLWIRETLALAEARPGHNEIATIALLPIPMLLVDAKILHGVIRGVFQKAGFLKAPIRGAIDVVWNGTNDDWILWARVLAIDVPPDAWGRLRALLRKAEPKWAKPGFDARSFGPNFPVRVQLLRDPERQVADLVNFHKYFWDRSPTGASRAVSMPADRLKELTDWVSNQTFRDFTFQFGMRTARKSSRSEKPSNA
jgi:hypothetical protein